MEQLLQYSSVPIQVEIVVNKPKFNYNTELPKVEVSRQDGGLRMRADPIRINIDNTNVRNSIGMKNIDTLARDFAQDSIRICYQAVAKIAQDGNKLMDTQNYTPAQIAKEKNLQSIETILSFLPKDGPDISWTGGTLSINYQADNLNFDWDLHTRPSFEFVPGSVEFKIKELPRLEIEYVGRPIYCPPSADPQYEEPLLDIKA